MHAQTKKTSRARLCNANAKHELQRKTKSYLPHRSVSARTDRSEVLVPLRYLPYGFVKLLSVESGSLLLGHSCRSSAPLPLPTTRAQSGWETSAPPLPSPLAFASGTEDSKTTAAPQINISAWIAAAGAVCNRRVKLALIRLRSRCAWSSSLCEAAYWGRVFFIRCRVQ